MIKGQEEIRAAYRNEKVARDYINRRFREPLGAIMHGLQVARLREVIRTLRPHRVLEIAPGPARLTVEIAADCPSGGTLVDTSAQMLAQARARLLGAGCEGWRLVQGDAFHLPFKGSFDLIYTFRLIRHFDETERARLYAGIARLLRPGGVLVFDAVNEHGGQMQQDHATGARHHYDALLNPDRIACELHAAGFTLTRLDDVHRHYSILYRLQVLVAPRARRLARTAMEVVGRMPGGRPLEWVVTCERR